MDNVLDIIFMVLYK